MAPRLEYAVKPARIGPDAHEELERLLENLHEHGVLRFANGVVSANAEIAKVLVDGLKKEGSVNAIQNLSVLLMALSRIPPAQFYKAIFAIRDAICAMGRERGDGERDEAPGLSGAYHMLNDDALWRGIGPLTDGLKAFGDRMHTHVDKPISDLTGKPGDV